MAFRPITVPKVADAVVDQIEELMVHGVLRPGDALPAERSLADELGVSRASLRDALDILAARGLIERKAGAGVTIADALDAPLAEPLARLIATRPEALDDFFAFRRLIEGDAARRCAAQAAPADRARLATILEEMRAAHAAGDLERGGRLDYEMHMTIHEASGNSVAMHVARALGRVLRLAVSGARAAIHARAGVSEALIEQHAALVEAILLADADAAEAASDRHLDFVAAELAAARADRARADRAALRPERPTKDL